MIIDENGIPRIEKPDVPDAVIQEYVNTDYQRLFKENSWLERECQRLRDTNCRMAHYNFFMRHTVQDELEIIDHLVKTLHGMGGKVSKAHADRIADFRKIAFPNAVQKHKKPCKMFFD